MSYTTVTLLLKQRPYFVIFHSYIINYAIRIYNTAALLVCCRVLVSLYLNKTDTKIASEKINIEKLIVHFKNETLFTTNDIQEFYRRFEPNVKVSTINWRVYKLVSLGILKRIGIGKFNIGKTRNYIPDINKKLKFFNNLLIRQFPFATFCIWQTSLLNEFMIHQPGKFYLLIETEKSTTESVFYFLKEKRYPVFHEPNEEIINKYIPEDKEPIIVKSLVSESPTQCIKGVNTVTIEKILVDVFCDEVIFAAQQDSEMINIFKSAFEKYTVNENRMLRYADRRRKKESLNNFLNSVSKFRQ